MKVIALVISIINALSGLICGILFIAFPDGRLMGMQGMTDLLSKFPLQTVFFRNFFWIGIAMLLMLFVPNAVAVFLTFRRSRPRFGAQALAGVCLLAWCLIEIIYLPNPAVWAYFAVALIHISCSLLVMRALRPAADRTGK